MNNEELLKNKLEKNVFIKSKKQNYELYLKYMNIKKKSIKIQNIIKNIIKNHKNNTENKIILLIEHDIPKKLCEIFLEIICDIIDGDNFNNLLDCKKLTDYIWDEIQEGIIKRDKIALYFAKYKNNTIYLTKKFINSLTKLLALINFLNIDDDNLKKHKRKFFDRILDYKINQDWRDIIEDSLINNLNSTFHDSKQLLLQRKGENIPNDINLIKYKEDLLIKMSEDNSKLLNTRKMPKKNLEKYNYLTTSNEFKKISVRLFDYFINKNIDTHMNNRSLFIGSFHGKEKTHHKYIKLRRGEQVIMNCVSSSMYSGGISRTILFNKMINKETTKNGFMKWIKEESETSDYYFKQLCVYDEKIPNVKLSQDLTGAVNNNDKPYTLGSLQGVYKLPLKITNEGKITSFKAFNNLVKKKNIDLHQIIKLLRRYKFIRFTLFITFCR